MKRRKIGFIGIGIMGKPMSKNLLKAGYPLVVNDINRKVVEEMVAVGAEASATPKEVAQKCELVITMLPNSPQVEAVVLGDNGILQGAKAGTIIVDMSSISPIVAKKLAVKSKEKGVEMLDAPVSGGESGAIEGTLAIMVGGKQEVFDQVEDIFSIVGSSSVLVGNHGSGSMTKLVNQIIVNLNIATISEAMVLAAKAGVDIEKVYKAIRGGLAGSSVLDAKIPRILQRDFKAGGRIDINLKDLTNVMETAHDIEVPLPFSSQLLEVLQSLKVDGKGEDDHGGIIQYFERLAGIKVK